MNLNIREFLLVEFSFQRPAARYNYYFLDATLWRVHHQPAGDVYHYVTHPDNHNAFTDRKILTRERRQLVVVVNKIFRGVHAAQLFSRESQVLGSLRAHCKNQCAWAESA